MCLCAAQTLQVSAWVGVRACACVPALLESHRCSGTSCAPSRHAPLCLRASAPPATPAPAQPCPSWAAPPVEPLRPALGSQTLHLLGDFVDAVGCPAPRRVWHGELRERLADIEGALLRKVCVYVVGLVGVRMCV